jgi:hypothetical protein
MTEQVTELTPEQQSAQDEAAFNSGFADEAPQTELKAPANVEVPTEKTEPTPAAEAPDPWKDVNPVIKQQFEEVSKRNAKLEGDLKATIGRVGALQSALDAAKAAKQAGQDAPSQSEVREAFKSPDGLKKLAEEWPDIGTPILDALADEQKRRQQEFEQFRKQLLADRPNVDVLGTVTPLLDKQGTEVIKKARELIKLDRKHEGWEDTIKQPEFAAWEQAQTAEIRALAQSDSAADAIRMLDLYAEHSKKSEQHQRKKERLAAATTPQGSGAGGPTPIDDDDAFLAGFNG